MTSYTSTLEKWKRKAKMEDEKMKERKRSEKNKKQAVKDEVPKPAKVTAKKIGKLPKISRNNTGQPSIRSFLKQINIEKTERAPSSNDCVATTVVLSET